MRSLGLHCVAVLVLLGGSSVWAADPPAPKAPIEKLTGQWQSMFDGKTLAGWKQPVFGGDGEVRIENGAIVMPMGVSLTGVTWTGPVAKSNYEFQYEGQRLDGYDFFATATFPVGDSHASFITGGWGGTVIGISSVDYYDASDNFTSKFFQFKPKQWYTFRIRVSDPKIEVWIDSEQVVDLVRGDHKFSVRAEVDLSKPLGLAAWCTAGTVRNLKIRLLSQEEVDEIKTAAKDQE